SPMVKFPSPNAKRAAAPNGQGHCAFSAGAAAHPGGWILALLPRLLGFCFPPFYFRFSNADGFCSVNACMVEQSEKSRQLPQLERPFCIAHLRISHKLSQNTVFVPSPRQPSQLICSGRIGALFSSDHNLAVFSRNAWSL